MTAMATDPIAPAPAGRQIVSTRVFDAPREALFRAFADPAALAKWWGPRGFTNTFQEFDLRPGGAWRFVMRGPDGAEFANVSRFVEVVPPERIAFRHEEPVHGFDMVMTFESESAGTRLTWDMTFDSVEEVARIGHLVVDGNEENFDRLAEVIARMG